MMVKLILYKLLREWRIKRNPIGYARSIGVQIGQNCKLVGLTGGTFGTEPYLVSLGDHVELSYEVRCVTHDGAVWVARSVEPDLDVIGTIEIGSNVFVGAKSVLLPGTKIGNDCVIGAGSVVRGTIPAASVAAGNPCRVIRSTHDYIERCIARGVRTHGLNPKEKKEFLLDHFGMKLDD